MLKLTTLTLTAGLALALGACGSSSTTSTGSTAGSSSAPASSVTKADFITKGDAVCTKYSAQTDALGEPPTLSDTPTADELKAFGAFLQKGETITEAELAEFKAIGTPSGDTAATGVVTAEETVITDLKATITAANAGDLATFSTAGQKLTTDGDAADKAADDYGFKSCGTGGSE